MELKEEAPRIETKPRFKILFLTPAASSLSSQPDYLTVSEKMAFDRKGLEASSHRVTSVIEKFDDIIAEGKKLKLLSLPETPRDYAAIIISGSPYTVRAEDFAIRGLWLRKTKEFLRQAVEDKIPVLGICFGAQILARALGGDVERIRPREVGCVKAFRRPGSVEDYLFKGLPSEFWVHENHEDFITNLPSNGVLLAENERGIQAFRVGQCAWGVIFHPERDPEVTRNYLEKKKGEFKEQGLDPEQLIKDVRPTPEAAKILTNFLDYVLSRTA